MSASLKENITAGATWRRGLYMLLFTVLYGVAEVVLTALVLYQFGSQLLTGRPNPRLLDFAQALASYIYQVILFLSYRSEVMPYPFAAWPAEQAGTAEELGSGNGPEDGG